ncbi:hypothetical protein JCM8097_008443 [Rhodosporidiobolus ruineniae]
MTLATDQPPKGDQDKEVTSYNDEGRLGYSPSQIDENSTDEELLAYQIDPVEKKALVRRLDMFIAPMVGILYLISFLDRGNVGNASVGGMFVDIGAPSNGLSVATSIFYATYVLFEPFWTSVMKILRPSRMLPIVVVLWGGVVLGNGFIENYASLLALRLLLGLLESSLTPCLFLAITVFYQRDELALRTSYMFVSAAVSGVVGGLIGAGLIEMNGTHGLAGWQWLYIVEGAITIGIGFLCFFFIADDPEHAWYLSPRQKLLMRVRDLQAREFTGSKEFSWAEVRKAFTEPIVYISGLVQFFYDTQSQLTTTSTVYGFSTFLVVIVKELGYNTLNSQLLTAPVYFVAAVVYVGGAYICDKYDVRYWLLLPSGLVTIVGYALLIGVQHSTGVKLFACFLAGFGIYISVGMHVSWLNSNVAGIRKRSTAIGLQQLMGNCGGILAGQVYRAQDKPYYRLGHAVSLGAGVLALLFLTLEVYVLRSRNARKLAMSEEEKRAQDAAGVTGDRHWSFKYVW